MSGVSAKNVGGILGSTTTVAKVNMNNNYNVGQIDIKESITAKEFIGGITGFEKVDNLTANYNYYREDCVTEVNSHVAGETKTDSYMKTTDFETDLNAELKDENGVAITVWKIVSGKNDGYPVLILE